MYICAIDILSRFRCTKVPTRLCLLCFLGVLFKHMAEGVQGVGERGPPQVAGALPLGEAPVLMHGFLILRIFFW